MKIYYDNMHKRIKAAIKKSGGYDRKYHLLYTIEKYPDYEKEINEIFVLARSQERLNMYLDALLIDLIPIEDIYKFHRKKVEEAKKMWDQLNTMTSMIQCD